MAAVREYEFSEHLIIEIVAFFAVMQFVFWLVLSFLFPLSAFLLFVLGSLCVNGNIHNYLLKGHVGQQSIFFPAFLPYIPYSPKLLCLVNSHTFISLSPSITGT